MQVRMALLEQEVKSLRGVVTELVAVIRERLPEPKP